MPQKIDRLCCTLNRFLKAFKLRTPLITIASSVLAGLRNSQQTSSGYRGLTSESSMFCEILIKSNDQAFCSGESYKKFRNSLKILMHWLTASKVALQHWG